MLTSPTQQSANRTVKRSELSSNWRTKVDAPPRGVKNAKTQGLDGNLPQDYIQQRSARLERHNADNSSEHEPGVS